MSMERFCLIFCSICVSAVLSLVTHEANLLLSHSPDQLYVRVGETAIFTCDFKALTFNPKDINWYKGTNDTQTKIADSTQKYTENNRLNLTTDWSQKTAVLRIKDVTMNDSGQYHCGHLNIEKNGLIFKSNTSKLIVQNLQYSYTIGTQLTNQKRSSEPKVLEKKTVIATSVVLVLFLLLLIGLAIFLVWYKQRNKMPQPQLRHLEKPSQDPDVFTVDYGVLDFGNNEPCRKPAEISIQEQVEYATIMFP